MKLYDHLRKFFRFIKLYSIYERFLYTDIKSGPIPRHIGVILDGNRRWARKEGLDKKTAYRIGAKKVEEIISWSKELGIKNLTLFVLSTENYMKRSADELAILFELLEEYLRKLLDDDPEKNKVRIRFIGNLDLLKDRNLKQLIEEVERKYSYSDSLTVNIAFLYGGKWDIVNATKRIVNAVLKGEITSNDISIETFQKYLSTSHLDSQDLDMVLRTGGEWRLSNFLLWEAAYSELIFMDVYWPEFRKIDFLRAIRIYQHRNRRFGA